MATRSKGEALLHAMQTAAEVAAETTQLYRQINSDLQAARDRANADEEEWVSTHWVERRVDAAQRKGLSRKPKTR
jgi:predicted  nucleic acid-binding Zn-ribbon protein